VLSAKAYEREPLRPSIAGVSPISIFRLYVAVGASDRAVGVTNHIATSDLTGAFALDSARSQVIALNRTARPHANCAVLRVVARVVAIGAALSRAGGHVVTVEPTAVATEFTAVFCIVARCHALIAANGSARIGLRTLKIAGICIALKVAIRGISAGTGFTRCAPRPVVRRAASDGKRDDTQCERNKEQTS
jgi:hypothetical protein